ncbi:MAG: hypothetical protein J6P58_03195 [Oscillospiraceae bacterium]|nr:hypothetical protein [Oscillospiraceae bacterium]
MADYKDRINGTISTLVGKAREFAASDTVTGIVDKVKSAAEESGVARVYEDGASRTKAYARIAKLTLAVNTAHEELNRVYAEIGKLYYEQAKDAPEGYFAPLFAQAGELTQGILEKENEVQSLKDAIEAAKAEKKAAGAEIDTDIADFEKIVDATESNGTAADKGEE